MSFWTISELMHLTRDELCDLAARIKQSLPEVEAGTVERLNALVTLDNIRRVMLDRGLHFDRAMTKRETCTPLFVDRRFIWLLPAAFRTQRSSRPTTTAGRGKAAVWHRTGLIDR